MHLKHGADGFTHLENISIGAGGPLSGDPWDSVDRGSGTLSVVRASNVMPADGAMAIEFAPTATNAAQCIWDQSFGEAALGVHASFTFHPTEDATATSRIWECRNSSGLLVQAFYHHTPSRFRLNGPSGQLWISQEVEPDITYRIEPIVVPGTTTSNGRIEFAVFDDKDSLVPIGGAHPAPLQLLTANAGILPISSVRYGRTAASADLGVFYEDNFQLFTDSDVGTIGALWEDIVLPPDPDPDPPPPGPPATPTRIPDFHMYVASDGKGYWA